MPFWNPRRHRPVVGSPSCRIARSEISTTLARFILINCLPINALSTGLPAPTCSAGSTETRLSRRQYPFSIRAPHPTESCCHAAHACIRARPAALLQSQTQVITSDRFAVEVNGVDQNLPPARARLTAAKNRQHPPALCHAEKRRVERSGIQLSVTQARSRTAFLCIFVKSPPNVWRY